MIGNLLDANKNVLIYTTVPLWDSQFVVTLELVLKHSQSIGNVIYLSCEGALTTCATNPQNLDALCKICKNKTHKAFKEIIPQKVKRFKVSNETKKIGFDFKSYEEFENLSYENMPIGRLVLSQLIDDFKDLQIPMAILKVKGAQMLNDGIALYEQAREIMKLESIDEVFVWNGRRNSDGPVLYAARSLGLKAFCYSSGGNPSRYFVQENSLHSISEWTKSIRIFEGQFKSEHQDLEAAASEFYNHQKFGKHENFNHTFFGQFHKEKSIPNLEKDKRHLVVFTSSLWESINYLEYKSLNDEIRDPYKLLLRLLNEDVVSKRFQITVRWHPALQKAGAVEQSKIREVVTGSQSVTHVLPDSLIDSYDLMAAADVVLTTGSTMGIEAAFSGKYSVVAGIAQFQNLGSCVFPTNYNELLALLEAEPSTGSPDGAILYGAFALNYGIRFSSFKFLDGEYQYEKRDLASILERNYFGKLRRFLMRSK
jgi:hypothetical protein